MKILPTFSCFDDALEFLEEMAKHNPATIQEFRLVHGIALAPEGPDAGEPFAHAWVERDGACIQAGTLEPPPGCPNPMPGKFYFGIDREEFYRVLRIQETTVYTPAQALQENQRTHHFGPWVETYRALCGRGRRMRFES